MTAPIIQRPLSAREHAARNRSAWPTTADEARAIIEREESSARATRTCGPACACCDEYGRPYAERIEP